MICRVRAAQHACFERVEIDHDEVDRRDVMRVHRRRMLGLSRTPSRPPWTFGWSVFTRRPSSPESR
jgi:hypothetical protein